MESKYLFYVSLSSTASVCGIVCNLFIVAVMGRTWYVEGSLRSIKLILFALGSFNAVIQVFQIAMDTAFFISDGWLMFYKDLYLSMYCAFCSMVLLRMWLVAWLCAFYCIRLVSFHNVLITFLKARFSRWLPWLVSISTMFSVILMAILLCVSLVSEPLENTGHSNVSSTLSLCTDGMLYGTSVPFLLTVASLGATLSSLGHHVLTLLRSSLSKQTSQMNVYLKAARTMILLIVLSCLFYLSLLTLTGRLWTADATWHLVCQINYYFFCLLLALTLICGTRKLSEAGGILCCHHGGRPREPETEDTKKTTETQ